MKKILISLGLLFFVSFGFAQKTYVELILDASGSMWNKLDDGRYRITAAKDVLTSFISGLPSADLNVGLRVYGSQISALEDNACDDTRLFVELNGVDKGSLSQTVQDAKAIGATPIAISLLAAADDFPSDAEKRLIILVTDGEESCGGDLQAVAADLKARGFDIDIRIIGFDLDQRAIESFKGIGKFENAQNAEQLAIALDTAVEDVVVEKVVENDCSLEAVIDAPAEVEASYPFSISFSGPEGKVSLHPKDADKFSALSSVYSGSSPAEMLAPGEVGDYELRFTANAGDCVIATSALKVVPTQVTLVPPTEVEASFSFTVEFDGPEGYIGIYDKTAAGRNDEITYFYTGWTNPSLTAPNDLGIYEVRYYDSNGVLLKAVDVNVTASKANISPPAEVEASFDFSVPFSGPEGHIGIYAKTATGKNDDITYFSTAWTNPSLTAPSEAGIY
ncbi:MAG TPA: VWA domain-containing protein, partial [Trueperaceae bacterium]|nr:VWA domain-containing protein [Trueperaceae bacterium]